VRGSWSRDRHKLREPGSAYDPDQETNRRGRLCCAVSVFELLTCCAPAGLLAAGAAAAIAFIRGAHR
jgi:hypothetical protein